MLAVARRRRRLRGVHGSFFPEKSRRRGNGRKGWSQQEKEGAVPCGGHLSPEKRGSIGGVEEDKGKRGMMEENPFHYTLITTYSSGRHLCTDPGPNSVPVWVHVGGGGGELWRMKVCLCAFSRVLNYVNAPLMPDEDNVLPCSFQVRPMRLPLCRPALTLKAAAIISRPLT